MMKIKARRKSTALRMLVLQEELKNSTYVGLHSQAHKNTRSHTHTVTNTTPTHIRAIDKHTNAYHITYANTHVHTYAQYDTAFSSLLFLIELKYQAIQ